MTLLLTALLAAQDPPGNGGDLPFPLLGMKDNFDRLRTGVVHVRGRKLDDDPGGARLEGAVDITVAFDFDRGLLRFDRTEPIRTGPSPSKPGGTSLVGGKYIRTPDRSITYLANDLSVNVAAPDETVPSSIAPFDVRVVGLIHYIDLERNIRFDDLFASLSKRPRPEVATEGGHLHRVRWTYDQDKVTRATLWLDEAQGFCPVRMETQDFRHDDSSWSDPKSLSQVTYAEKAGVWVPVSARIEERRLAPRVMSYDFTFDWESVNRPVDDRYFAIDGMDLPKGTYIIDRRLGKPVVTGGVGTDHLAVVREVSTGPPPTPARASGRSWAIIAGANLALLAVVCTAWWRRWGATTQP